MLLSMVRTKFAAVLIGTAGAGLLANFGAIQGLVGTLAGLGIGSSAVRDVAAAVAAGDQAAIGRTVLTLRRMCWLTGLVGMAAMMALSPLLAQWTFGTQDHTLEIAALGLIILFGNLSGGHTALINGMRRIGDLARLGVISAVVGTVVSIGFYLWLGLRGIVPALVLASAINLIITWQYAKRVPVLPAAMTWAQSFSEASGMVKMGSAMMWNNFLISFAAYITIQLITNNINIQAAGIYSAAFALSGIFVNFILTAMGADYYPRLSSLSQDKVGMCKLINEQTEISLLLAAPGLLVTITMAPWLIRLFYSPEFLPAVQLLQWFVLGCLGRIISWPLGWLTAAMQKSWWLVILETCSIILHLILIATLLQIFGLEGVAIAFFMLYVCYATASFFIGQKLIGFTWSTNCKKLKDILVLLIIVNFILAKYFPILIGAITGLFLTTLVSIYCLKELINRLDKNHRIIKFLLKFPSISKLMSI